jgi:hypothetical protein
MKPDDSGVRHVSPTDFWNSERVFLLLAAAALILGTAARLIWVDDKALLNDEGFSLRVALLPFSEGIHTIQQDVHPPLYFILLHIWLVLFPGDNTGRLLSVLTGTLAIVPAALLARRILPPVQAGFAATLIAILPLLVSWSQISRGYGLLQLCTVLALLAGSRLLAMLDLASGRPAVRPFAVWAALYVAGAASALWTHNIAVLLVFAINVAALWRLLSGRLALLPGAALWSCIQLAVLLVWAPWVPNLLEQSGRLGAEIFLVDARTVAERLGYLFGGFMLWTLAPIAGAIGFAALVLGVFRVEPRSAEAQVALAATIVPILACLSLFASGRPAFGYSLATLIWVPTLVAIFMAANLRWPARHGRAAALLGLGLTCASAMLTVRGLSNWYGTTNPGWDRVVAEISRAARPGDVVLAYTPITASDEGISRGGVPLHALAAAAEQGAQLPPFVYPPDTSATGIGTWLGGQQRVWVPAHQGMPAETTAMAAIAWARERPAEWQITEFPVPRLTLMLLELR